MWQAGYAKEPFDLKLFVLRSAKLVHWILISAVIGALSIGGIYYLKNVTLGGKIPYEVIQKLDVEFAQNPDTGTEYSYYVAYTWNDWVKSDAFTSGLEKRLPEGMSVEEAIGFYEMTLAADVRNPYMTVKHADAEMALLLSEVLAEEMISFFGAQNEIEEITVIDVDGPTPEFRDIRTFRAVVLGAVVGTFFALFAIAFKMILDEGIFLPETFTYRYQIPVVGYLDADGVLSEETKAGLSYLFKNMIKVGVTAVEPDIDLAGWGSMPDGAVCLPSVLQVPESLAYLRANEGNLLLVQAGVGNGKAVESVLYLCKMHDVNITAALLVGADRELIERYRFGFAGKKEEM